MWRCACTASSFEIRKAEPREVRDLSVGPFRDREPAWHGPLRPIVFGSLGAFLLTLLALGALSRRRVRDITHKGEQEAWAARIRIEERDVPEMVEAQNRYRRRHDRPELSERELREQIGRQELERLDRADAEVRARER
jgi:hypothetical protein